MHIKPFIKSRLNNLPKVTRSPLSGQGQMCPKNLLNALFTKHEKHIKINWQKAKAELIPHKMINACYKIQSIVRICDGIHHTETVVKSGQNMTLEQHKNKQIL